MRIGDPSERNPQIKDLLVSLHLTRPPFYGSLLYYFYYKEKPDLQQYFFELNRSRNRCLGFCSPCNWRNFPSEILPYTQSEIFQMVKTRKFRVVSVEQDCFGNKWGFCR